MIRKAKTSSESGSWCYNPPAETTWGQATSVCCPEVHGRFDTNSKRCFDLSGSGDFFKRCTAFYRCCVLKFSSGNHPGDDGCN